MKLRNVLAAAAISVAALAAPASATVVTFASFNPIGNTANFRWVISTNNNAGNFSRNATFYTTATANGNAPGTRNVNFSFLQPAIAPYATNITAAFTMNGTVTNTIATVSGSTISQSNVNGSFSFISTSAITIGSTTFAAGSNLLSGTFTTAELSGTRNGTSAGLTGSTPTTTISYTSDFLSFVGGSNYDFALNLTSIAPLLNATNAANQITGAPNKALRTFRAVVGGSFSSDPAPIPPAIPEPQTWFLLMAGFGLVGVSARRRRTSVAA